MLIVLAGVSLNFRSAVSGFICSRVIVVYGGATLTALPTYHGGVRENIKKMRGDLSNNPKCFPYGLYTSLTLPLAIGYPTGYQSL